MLALCAFTVTAQPRPGTTILNQASVEFVGSSGSERIATSNEVTTVIRAERTAAQLEVLRVFGNPTAVTLPIAASVCTSAGQARPLGAPVLQNGMVLDPGHAINLTATDRHHGGDPLLIRLIDRDRNLAADVVEQAAVSIRNSVTGDIESVLLAETGTDSGEFTGHLPTRLTSAAIAADCALQSAVNSQIEISYVDVDDPSDQAAASVHADPVSRVFNAFTGAPVDGARITLLDAATGLEARPLDDDGVSAFPATVQSGASGIPGAYRFPVVAPGRYRLVIEPPPGFAAPSQQSEPALQALDGAPWFISGASFAGEFLVDAAVLQADIPVDPSAGALFVDKQASAETAGVGDFVEFSIAVTHTGGSEPATDVRVVDRLPSGLRYVADSATLLPDGRTVAASIAEDGSEVVFALDQIPADAGVTLRYIAAVVPGTRARELTNTAFAQSTTAVSNTARAVIRITDSLFNDAAFLAGRVTTGACPLEAVDETQGLAGVRIYLEDGRFAVTDEHGRYHFEGLQPGMHAAQVDVESLPEFVELVSCSDDPRAARSTYSRFVDLSPGALGRADFYTRILPPPRGMAELVLQQRVAGERFDYDIEISGSSEPVIDSADLMIMLPDGTAYIGDSARDDSGQALTVRQSGNVLTIALPGAEMPERVSFAARPDPELDGVLTTRALLRFEALGERHQTPVAETTARVSPATAFSREYVLRLNFATLSAELRDTDIATLDVVADDWRGVAALRVSAVGHSDYLPISPASRTIFADNYELSYARANAVVAWLSEALDIDPARITVEGVGPDRPIADNRTAQGRAENRRVELSISGLAPDAPRAVEVLAGDSGAQFVEFEGQAHTLPTSTVAAVGPTATRSVVVQPDFDIETQPPGQAILWPPEAYSPPIPSTRIVVRHAPGDELNLQLNGRPVSALHFDGQDHNADGSVAISRWRGVDLGDGGNELVVTITDRTGASRTMSRALHFAGPPVRAELLAQESVLVADGRTRPRLAVRFLDRWGRPARAETTGYFSVEAPYRSWAEIEQLRDNSVIAVADRRPAYQVGPDGLAWIELEPTTRSGEVRLQFEYAREYPQDVRAWLRPAAREWILVGLVEGTLGWNQISGSMERAVDAGVVDGYGDDGRIAFFAKGQVKGAVLTAAFDSNGDGDDVPLGGVIDPDRYYVLYGDNTEQRFDAASTEKLYLKIERDAFAALFGDFETGMTITELSRYSRTLTGFQAERRGDRVGFTTFAADTDQAFVRDELRGDGTSGPYQLTNGFILSGSDKLRIEVRDRFRPERVVSERTLARHVDYDIDYNAGTIFFREPVASRDFGFDPVYIVVEYETRDEAVSSLVLGGRAAVDLSGGGSELGVTVVRDTTPGAAGDLRGADFRYDFGAATQLRAEIAQTRAEQPAGTDLAADAWLVEFEHQHAGRQLQAYARETGEGFGLGQQRVADSGTRRTGVRMRNEFSESWAVESEAFRQRNLIDAATRTVVESTGRYQDQRRVAIAGLRRVEETIAGNDSSSSQAIVGGSWKFFDSLLTTRTNIETELDGKGASADYPTRALFGLDLSPGPRITLFAEREIAEGDAFDAAMTRIGARTSPTDRSRIDTSLSSELTEFGPRNFANLGMNHAWNLGERWVLDVGMERSRLLSEGAIVRPDDRVPVASGSLSGDFTSAFTGLGYRGPDWTVSSRMQWRSGEADRHRGFVGGFYREPVSGRGFSAELNVLERSSTIGTASFDGRLRLGWAHRPDGSRWIVYDRLDWTASRQEAAGLSNTTRRFVNQINAHFTPDYRHELAVHHALKYVRSDFEAFTASGIVNLVGIDWRRRLNERFDFGMQASWYAANAQNINEHGLGFDVSFAVAGNMLMHVGYNIAGFDDEDFSRSRYTSRGPFVRFSMRLDQASLRELLRR